MVLHQSSKPLDVDYFRVARHTTRNLGQTWLQGSERKRLLSTVRLGLQSGEDEKATYEV